MDRTDFAEFQRTGARPPIAPALGAGSAPAVPFPGIARPSSDFQATRDGRRSPALGYLVDLSSARSFAAGTALLLDVQGNLFYADPLFDLTGISQAGIARVHFQDENFNPVGTYVTALPSSIFKMPFTRVAIENYAQAGKFLYIVYGVDIDLSPGTSQQVQATILNATLNAINYGNSFGVSYQATGALAAFTPVNVVAAASNLAGLRIMNRISVSSYGVETLPTTSLLMKATAPATDVDGDVMMIDHLPPTTFAGWQVYTGARGEAPVITASGKRLDWISNAVQSNGQRVVQYTIL